MDLLELCALHGSSPSSDGLPAWVLGCFKRRSISFFNGDSDDTTLVVWLQSRGLTGDLRLAADRPRVESRAALKGLSTGELQRLAEAEGGLATTRFDAEATSGVELTGLIEPGSSVGMIFKPIIWA